MTKSGWRKLYFFLFSIFLHLGVLLFFYILNLKSNNYSNIQTLQFTTLTDGYGFKENPGFSGTPKVEEVPKPIDKKANMPKQEVKINNAKTLTSELGEPSLLKDTSKLKKEIPLDSLINHINLLTDSITSDTVNFYEFSAINELNDGGGNGPTKGKLIKAQLPLFMGSNYNEFSKWINKNYNLYDENFAGKVWIKFIVNVNGELTNIDISNCPNANIKKELTRILKSSPKWTPGMQRNKPINIIFTMPINFYGY